MPRLRPALEALLLALALAGCAGTPPAGLPLVAQAESEKPSLAIMGTIPIYWGEAAGVTELIGGGANAHWARAELERRYRLVPVDYLSEEALAGQSRLLLAQPRGLTPEENVALDAWVRQGGRLLLFTDPMMTGESRFGIGDRRRPQDVALLSPILAHWGIELQFDDMQDSGLATREIAGTPVPINLAGRFAVDADAANRCSLAAMSVFVECELESGAIRAFADAAVLDFAGPWPGAGEALEQFLDQAFGQTGENAGR